VQSPFALAALPSAYRSERRVAFSDASHCRGVTTATETWWSHAVSALARQQPTCPRAGDTCYNRLQYRANLCPERLAPIR
jgi:hypothetical protein